MNESDKGENCRNCGMILKGDFCHSCGQSSKVMRRPARDLFEDAFSHIFQWDSRLLTTLRFLFFSPGRLPEDWVAGKRMRYVPPFRLYIIISFILFLLVGIAAQQNGIDLQQTSYDGGKVSREILEAEQKATANGEWFSALMLRGVGKAVENPAGYARKILANLPKAAFLCVPIFALLHLAVEFRRDKYYIDYLVFSLHLHAFAFSILTIILLAGIISQTAGNASQFLNFAIPVYGILAIRRFNPQGWMKSCLKGILLFGAYSIFLGIGLALFFTLLLLV